MRELIKGLTYSALAVLKPSYFKNQKTNLKIPKIKLNNLVLPVGTQGLNQRLNEPISFFIFAKSEQVFEQFLEKTGWFDAEEITFYRTIKNIIYNLLNRAYDRAQLTPYYWNGNTQDYNIQKPTEKHTIRERHHARFWKSNLRSKGLCLFVGMSSFDSGMDRIIAHTIDPDLDKERDFLFSEFKKTGMIKTYEKINISKGKIEGQDFMGDKFFSDGKGYLIYLK